MEIGYIAKRTLVPTLMEWVSKSRIQNHLPEHCIFIMWLDDSIQFNLSNLDDAYQTKHVLPDLSIYCLSLIYNITPVIETWCQKNNLHNFEMNMRFKCQQSVYTTSRMIKGKKEDKENREYLENKST